MFEKAISFIASVIFGTLGIPQMFPEVLKLTIFHRAILFVMPAVLVTLIIFLVSTYSKWIVYVAKISNKLAYFLSLLIFHRIARVIYLSIILLLIVWISNFNYSIISLSGLAFIIILLSYKQFPSQDFNRREIIFEDDFLNNDNGWQLNYWGVMNPNKATRFENSMIVFEASEDELLHSKKEYGAYIDLKNGIEEGLKYEISCVVRSDLNTTMKFQVWLHDNTVGLKGSTKSVMKPKILETPNTNFKEINLEFVATSTKGIRIHLHNRGGAGKILVDKITVAKI